MYRSLNVLSQKLVFFAKNDDTYLENQDKLKQSVKKTFESSGWDQGMFFIQIGGQVNRFGSRNQQSKNVSFLRNWLFQNNCLPVGRKMSLGSLCFSRQNASIIFMIILKGNSQNLTSGQGQVVTRVGSKLSWCLSVDSSWRDELKETYPTVLVHLAHMLLTKNRVWPLVNSTKLYHSLMKLTLGSVKIA